MSPRMPLSRWSHDFFCPCESARPTRPACPTLLPVLPVLPCRLGLCLRSADRIRRHLRRCDEGKGYMSKRTTIEDTYAVLHTLALRGIRKAVWVALINKFHFKPGEVGDKDYCAYRQPSNKPRSTKRRTLPRFTAFALSGA